MFEFLADEAAAIECRLDLAPSPGESPMSYLDLPDGSHTGEVRAIDTAGNADSTPATVRWTVSTGTVLRDGFGSGSSGQWTVRTGGDGTARCRATSSRPATALPDSASPAWPAQ